jgi:hypothetical protein
MKSIPDFRLNEMITEDMVSDEYDRKTSCQLRFQQTSVEVKQHFSYEQIKCIYVPYNTIDTFDARYFVLYNEKNPVLQ